MQFMVESTEGGQRVDVEAVDWMMAMAQATPKLGIEASGWMCVNQPDGRVQVFDPMSGKSWIVTRLATEAPPPQRIARPGGGPPTFSPPVTKPVTPPVVASNAPPESLAGAVPAVGALAPIAAGALCTPTGRRGVVTFEAWLGTHVGANS